MFPGFAAGVLLGLLCLLLAQRLAPAAHRRERKAWTGLQCRWPIRETCRRWRRRQAQLQRVRAVGR